MQDQTKARIQDSDQYSQQDLLNSVKLDELEQGQRDELLKIVEYLTDESDPIDSLLLYEITGYRADSVQNWDQYEQSDDQSASEQETVRKKGQIGEQDESNNLLLTKQ